LSEANERDEKDFGSRHCSSADANDPHLALAACFIHRVFSDYGHEWGGKLPSQRKIAKFVAEQINLMRRGKMSERSFGGLMFCRDPLTEIVEVGVSITHHFPDDGNMVG
jgi:hypothetical protein